MRHLNRTQVAIIGSGPSGLLLSQLLHLHGIDSVVLERQTRRYVEERIRAGVLEPGTTELLLKAKVGERMVAERLVHDGFELGFSDRTLRVDLKGLAGSPVSVYGQTEITKDLMDARMGCGGKLIFEASQLCIERFDASRPLVRYTQAGRIHELACDYIAGCDGYHGVCRQSVPVGALQSFERVYPFGWLGVLADVPPATQEIVYSNHDRGFAMCSMRSRTRSRALSHRTNRCARSVFPAGAASHMEGGSVLVVVHLHHASILRRSFRASPAIGGARVSRGLDGGADEHCRELRWAAFEAAA